MKKQMPSKSWNRVVYWVGLGCLLGGLTLIVYVSGCINLIDAWTAIHPLGVANISGKLPAWDFSNLWMGGYLARAGEIHTLFDVGQYRAYLDTFFHVTLRRQEWSYPPQMLLIGAPLSLLPLGVAHALWIMGTTAGCAYLLYRQGLPARVIALAILAPGMITNAMLGQNAAFTTCLLLGSLVLGPTRPLLAGLLLGLLTAKPHLGLIGLVGLLACGNWRAMGAASITALLMATTVTLWLGVDVWQLWLQNTVPYMTTLMDTEHDQQKGMLWSITVFYYLRGWGVTLPVAYQMQWIITAASMLSAWILWRRTDIGMHQKLALSAILTLFSTPYAHMYDLALGSIAVALLLPYARHWVQYAVLYLLWIYPFLVPALSRLCLPLPPLILVTTAVLFYPRRRQSRFGEA